MPQSIAELHRTGIGGTFASALMGYNRHATKYDVYAEILGIKPETETNVAMRIGTHNEPFIRQWYEETTGKKGGPAFLRHPKYPWMIGNLDWLADDRKSFGEFKVAGLHTFREWGDPENGEIPQEYYFQGLHYAMLTGIREWDFCPMLGTEIRRYPMRWNDSLVRRLFNVEKHFWENHIVPKVPPEVDYTESCANLMKWMHPKNEDSEIRHPKDSAEYEALKLLAECKVNFKAEEDNLRQCENRVKSMIGAGAGIESDLCKATWKADKRGIRIFRVKVKGELDDGE